VGTRQIIAVRALEWYQRSYVQTDKYGYFHPASDPDQECVYIVGSKKLPSTR